MVLEATGGPLQPRELEAPSPAAGPYALPWGERSLRSVANLTHRDGHEFLELAGRAGIETQVTTFSLEVASRALDALRHGSYDGAGVILP